MRAAEVELNSGAVMAPNKTDNVKKRTADARARRFWVNRFWASGMYVEILLYAILFTSKSIDHHCKVPVWRNPQYFLNEETHSPEREEKKK